MFSPTRIRVMSSLSPFLSPPRTTRITEILLIIRSLGRVEHAFDILAE